MNNSDDLSISDLPHDQMLAVNQACDAFERALSEEVAPDPKAFLTALDEQATRVALREMIAIELEHRSDQLDPERIDAIVQRYSLLPRDWLQEQITVALSQPMSKGSLIKSIPNRLGEYEILESIGSGGMGNVYRAQHRRMHRIVALKVLKRELATNVQSRRRFEREVQAAAKLIHPHVVTAFDAGEDQGWQYLVTEFVEGIDLSRLVKTRGPLPLPVAIDYVIQAAKGLAYAHQRQVIHRDVKPSNLLLDEHGSVKILDLGLARLHWEIGDEERSSELTQSGAFMGTAAFMAPEQARNTRHADARSDIYSLGCVLYYLLSGNPVHLGETVVETILLHATKPMPRLDFKGVAPSQGQRVEGVLAKMIAKDPSDRYANMDEVIAALQACLGDVDASKNNSPSDSAIANVRVEGLKPAEKSPIENARVESLAGAGRRARGLVMVLAAMLFAGGMAWGAFSWYRGKRSGGSDHRLDPVGRQRFAVRFNGASSYLEIDSLVNQPDEALTLEAIVSVRANRVANLVSLLGPDWMTLFTTVDGSWGVSRMVDGESRLIQSVRTAELERWTHIAGVWDGKNLKLFVDGQEAETHPLIYNLNPTRGGLYIGGVRLEQFEHRDDRFFHGAIDAVRIQRGVQYTKNFSPPKQLEADRNTIALYLLDAGKGTIVRDDSGNGHDGRMVDAVWESVDH